MDKDKINWGNFLKYFITEEKFLQNPLLKTDEFIKFCVERGVETREEELEFFEKEGLFYPVARINVPIEEDERIRFRKDGKEYWRPAGFALQEGEELVERYSVQLYAYQNFGEGYKESLLELFERGDLFHPSERQFQKWRSFKGERLENGSEKVMSFYSSFQIYALQEIKKYSYLKLPFCSYKISLDGAKLKKDRINGKGLISFKVKVDRNFNPRLVRDLTDDEYNKCLKNNIEFFKSDIDWAVQKRYLSEVCKEFDNLLKFFLVIQSAYVPYMKSGSRTIQLSNIEDKEWQELKRRFDLSKELALLGLDINFVCKLYNRYCREAESLLGGFSNDWAQIFKNISWDMKNNLKGNIRLGIDYLQWAIMLKRILEEYLKRRIFDIDEAGRLKPEYLLEINPSDRNNKNLPMLRNYRNSEFYDEQENKDYYYNKNKRLFYLANSFNLDYQPKVMLFVEGETEENVLPRFFEWYSGISPEDMGVEIINFKGVDQLLSTSDNANKLRNLLIDLQREERQPILSKSKNRQLNQIIKDLQEVDIVISNWTSFLSYNLEKWQIIPFFISDNEGNIKHFLESDKPIMFEGAHYNVPKRWRFLWGVDNGDYPFKGNNFELANFGNEEISSVLTKVLGRRIAIEEIQPLRDSNDSINRIDGAERNKINIGKELIQNLIELYERTKDEAILKRPLSLAINKVLELSTLNHLPKTRKHELINKAAIKKWLCEQRSSFSFLSR